MPERLASFQDVGTGPPDLEKVHHLEVPEMRRDRLDGLGEHRLPCFPVDQPEFPGAEAARDGALRCAGLVARMAVGDPPGPHIPSFDGVRFHPLQLQTIEVKDEGIRRLRFVSRHQAGDLQIGHLVPRYVADLPDDMVPKTCPPSDGGPLGDRPLAEKRSGVLLARNKRPAHHPPGATLIRLIGRKLRVLAEVEPAILRPEFREKSQDLVENFLGRITDMTPDYHGVHGS
jgi:hypothetical protein